MNNQTKSSFIKLNCKLNELAIALSSSKKTTEKIVKELREFKEELEKGENK